MAALMIHYRLAGAQYFFVIRCIVGRYVRSHYFWRCLGEAKVSHRVCCAICFPAWAALRIFDNTLELMELRPQSHWGWFGIGFAGDVVRTRRGRAACGTWLG